MCIGQQFSGDNIMWYEMGKQNIQAKKVYSQLSLRQTPLGPALSVRLREVSIL